MAASITARRSTLVAPTGTPTMTRVSGTGTTLWWITRRMKYSSIVAVASNSEMTPSRIGRIVTTLGGVRPMISFAARPTFSTRRDFLSMATQEGSLMTMPLLWTLTSVLAVPRSIAISRVMRPSNH